MVIGGGAFMEMQKSAAPEKAVLGQDHESAQVQRAVNDRLLDESLFVEVKGFSGAGRAISSASRAASSAGKVGRAAGDVGKTVGTAGKAAGDAGKAAGDVGKAAGDVAKLPEL